MNKRRGRSYTPNVQMPGASRPRQYRGVFSLVLCLLIPPLGVLFLWRMGVFRTRGRVLITALATVEMTILAVLIMPKPTLNAELPVPGMAERAASLFLDRPLPAGAVKTARYPEWMTALGISGLYSPWTGEAIVSPLAAPAALTFTACHELMHLAGIADEGQANIAAWSACHRLGGETADSADLWALRYALATLMEADADAWRDCIRRMGTPLREVFGGMNGFSPPSRRASPAMDAVLAIAGLTETAASYDALAAWLAIDIPTGG